MYGFRLFYSAFSEQPKAGTFLLYKATVILTKLVFSLKPGLIVALSVYMLSFAAVKKVLLYILMLLLIGDGITDSQIVKLPNLYGHFKEHRLRNPAVSFFDYLAMHYWGNDINDNDDEQDMKLPFKKVGSGSPVLLYLPGRPITFYNSRSFWQADTDFSPEHTGPYFNPAGKSLFRPPQA